MRSLAMSVMVAALSLAPLAGTAAVGSAPPSDTSVLLAQGGPPQGWWEREGRVDELRERYWRLPPPQRARYDYLEAGIRARQEAIDRARREQYQLLHWGGY